MGVAGKTGGRLRASRRRCFPFSVHSFTCLRRLLLPAAAAAAALAPNGRVASQAAGRPADGPANPAPNCHLLPANERPTPCHFWRSAGGALTARSSPLDSPATTIGVRRKASRPPLSSVCRPAQLGSPLPSRPPLSRAERSRAADRPEAERERWPNWRLKRPSAKTMEL